MPDVQSAWEGRPAAADEFVVDTFYFLELIHLITSVSLGRTAQLLKPHFVYELLEQTNKDNRFTILLWNLLWIWLGQIQRMGLACFLCFLHISTSKVKSCKDPSVSDYVYKFLQTILKFTHLNFITKIKSTT